MLQFLYAKDEEEVQKMLQTDEILEAVFFNNKAETFALIFQVHPHPILIFSFR
jgi:hypothetical protein